MKTYKRSRKSRKGKGRKCPTKRRKHLGGLFGDIRCESETVDGYITESKKLLLSNKIDEKSLFHKTYPYPEISKRIYYFDNIKDNLKKYLQKIWCKINDIQYKMSQDLDKRDLYIKLIILHVLIEKLVDYIYEKIESLELNKNNIGTKKLDKLIRNKYDFVNILKKYNELNNKVSILISSKRDIDPNNKIRWSLLFGDTACESETVDEYITQSEKLLKAIYEKGKETTKYGIIRYTNKTINGISSERIVHFDKIKANPKEYFKSILCKINDIQNTMSEDNRHLSQTDLQNDLYIKLIILHVLIEKLLDYINEMRELNENKLNKIKLHRLEGTNFNNKDKYTYDVDELTLIKNKLDNIEKKYNTLNNIVTSMTTKNSSVYPNKTLMLLLLSQ